MGGRVVRGRRAPANRSGGKRRPNGVRRALVVAVAAACVTTGWAGPALALRAPSDAPASRPARATHGLISSAHLASSDDRVDRTGSRQRGGGRRDRQSSLDTAALAAATTDTATLIQTIDTSKWNPASPDPAGVTYRPSRDRLLVADSEVDEKTGAGYHGVNLWEITRNGNVTNTGTTVPFTNEPTGLGFDPATETLFVSTDVGNKVWVVNPGGDGKFGTSDDPRTSIDTRGFGLRDTEDPAFDQNTGDLFFVDGVTTEVYRLDPVDGQFGNGNDHLVGHFDVGKYGAKDTEALAWDPGRDTLAVGDRPSRKIYEVTKDGALVRIVDASNIAGMKRISGMTVAPASNDPSALHYWIVDRAVDNGSSSSENDGKLFEISAPGGGGGGPTNTPPVVSAGPNQTITLPNAATLQGSVTDDGLPNPPGVTTSLWSKVSGPGSVGFADATSPATTATFSTDGSYVLRLTADDSAAQRSDDVSITVLPEGGGGGGGGGGGSGVIEVQVSATSDDAEETSGGSVRPASSDLELVQDDTQQTVGMRFTSVAVPAGATITSAYVQFRSDEVGNVDTSLAITGEDADDPGTFVKTIGNISSRPRTSQAVGW
ncbi:MAG TPA: hypothetical protein VFT27_11195, partial [Actinomycetota bacterium]|nr:hypothetical protein [Actinomycetota bacterium]